MYDGDRRQRVVDEVRRDLGPQRAQLGRGASRSLLRLELRQLDLGATPARRASATTRDLLEPHPPGPRVAARPGCRRGLAARAAARRSPPRSGQPGCAHRSAARTRTRSARPGPREQRRAVAGVVVVARRRRRTRARASRPASATASAPVSSAQVRRPPARRSPPSGPRRRWGSVRGSPRAAPRCIATLPRGSSTRRGAESRRHPRPQADAASSDAQHDPQGDVHPVAASRA